MEYWPLCDERKYVFNAAEGTKPYSNQNIYRSGEGPCAPSPNRRGSGPEAQRWALGKPQLKPGPVIHLHGIQGSLSEKEGSVVFSLLRYELPFSSKLLQSSS